MDDGYIEYLKNLILVQKQTTKSIESAADAERTMFDVTLQREKKMNERDGSSYSDEEMEEIAMKQVENSPARKDRDTAIELLEEAYLG